MISNEDDRVITDLAASKITLDEFYKRFSIDLLSNPHSLREMWKMAIQEKDKETMQNVLFVECYLYSDKYGPWRPDDYYIEDIRRFTSVP